MLIPTTFQECCNFLANEKAVVSFAPNPANPVLARLTIRVGDADWEGPTVAAIEYNRLEGVDLLNKAFIPACQELAKKKRDMLASRRPNDV